MRWRIRADPAFPTPSLAIGSSSELAPPQSQSPAASADRRGSLLSLLVCLQVCRFDLPDREAVSHGVGESGDSWRFPTSRRVLLCWQVFASLALVVSFPRIRVSLPFPLFLLFETPPLL